MMSATDDTAQGRVEETPDPIRYYRPVAIRSVVAAHKMIPRVAPQLPPEPMSGAAAMLPAGFHTIPED